MKLVRTAQGFVQIVIIAVMALVIGAAAIYGYQKLTTKPSPSPSPTDRSIRLIEPSPSPTDETANWKTYESTNFKYTFKYPPNWILTDCDGSIVMLGPDVYTRGMCQTGAISLIQFSVENSPAETLIDNDFLSIETADNYTENSILIAGKKSIRHSGTWKVQGELDLRGTNYIRNWIPLKASQTILIGYTQYKNTSDYTREFDQILSTFRFLE